MKPAETILLVDDEDCVRKLVRTLLNQFGYQNLLEANGAGQALQIARHESTPIHLLLSDISLGSEIDATQLARLVTTRRPDTKVLLISGRPDLPMDLEPEWQFLAKPFVPSQLLLAVRTALQAAAVQVREATAELTVFTLDLKKKIIPAGAILDDFRIGRGHEGLLSQDMNVASFHHGGEVLFNLAREIVDKTRALQSRNRVHAA